MRALAVLCCCIAWSVQAEIFSAKVIVVIDGDTVMVLREGGSRKAKVRLANIDAPEKDQEFGKQSRESLKELVGGKLVKVDSLAIDQYGRTVAQVTVDGINVNREQVRRGMAWTYSHSHSDKTHLALQSDAQQARRGLWSQAGSLAPWQWRKLHPSNLPVAQSKQLRVPNPSVPVILHDLECGKKSQCSQMHSCDEAYFYFNHCGARTLDGNRDGMPCASVCAVRK
jgi:endonuclease YncB( thermonuclease family)